MKRTQESENKKGTLKSKAGKEIIGWVKALIYAVVAVIIINIFVLENIMVPTTSMVPVILPEDRFFVEKISYQFQEPEYGDIIAFWTPFADRDAQKKLQPFDHFMNSFYGEKYKGHVKYVKRLIGKSRDILEMDYNKEKNGYNIVVNGNTPEKLKGKIYKKTGLFVDPDFLLKIAYPDRYKFVLGDSINEFKNINENTDYTSVYQELMGDYERKEYAWYDEEQGRVKIKVPDGMYFALGDNSADSFDCRYFGFIPEENLVGKPLIRFWPLNRFGIVE